MSLQLSTTEREILGIPDLQVVHIPLEDLLFPKNMPAGMNPLVVMSLAYFYRSDHKDARPIIVQTEGDFFRIKDGRHRSMGSMIAGRPGVLSVIERHDGEGDLFLRHWVG
jgi:hypothetical protein